MAIEDEELERAFSIDPESHFQAVYDRYSASLFRFLYRFTANSQNSEDILHEIFVELLDGKFRSSHDSSLKSWLFAVAKNKALNHRKKSSRETITQDVERESDEDLEINTIQSSLLIHLNKVEKTLPQDLRETWQLRKSGLDYQTIATQLSIPVGTVKSRFSRIVELLRKEFNNEH